MGHLQRNAPVVAAAAMLVAVLGAWQTPGLPQVEQRIIEVSGDKAFTNTGLTLRPGDRVTVAASGRVYFSGNAQQSGVGPDGWPWSDYGASWPDDYNACPDPLESVAGHAALIGDVNGQRFAVGQNRSFTGKAGLFYLGINDCSFTGAYRNTGKFIATVKVERALVPKK